MSQPMSQSYETLLLERRGRVAVVTINRPDKRNALNIKTREEGAALLEQLGHDDSVGVVVFTGAGEKAFIAGADIAEFADRTAITQRDVMKARSLFTAIDTFPKPIASAVLASMMSPVRISSIAFPSPTSRVRRCVPPPPGMIPRLISGCPNDAVSLAIRMSQARASSQPPPRQ